MAEIEGVGELATGAALARAVEPRTGAAGDGHTHEANCLNCGAPLAGAYCSRCGQRGHVHRTIGAWWHDFVHSVLHVDGKFWATIRLLAWRPGDLTRRYIHGERAKFVSPMALFLFTVFLMFAAFSALGSMSFDEATGIDSGIEEGVTNLEETVARLERQRAEAIAAGRPTTGLDAALTSTREELDGLKQLQETGVLSGEGTTVQGPVDADLGDAPAWLGSFEGAYNKAKQNPSLLFYKLQANAYKFSWALIPISVPFVWMLFLHRRRYRREFTGYDHLVFVTYSIAFMSMVLVAMVVVDALGIDNDLIDVGFLLIPPLHMYRQLRGAYCLSRWSAAWRAIALLVFAALALSLFFLLLLAIGVFG